MKKAFDWRRPQISLPNDDYFFFAAFFFVAFFFIGIVVFLLLERTPLKMREAVMATPLIAWPDLLPPDIVLSLC